MLRLVVVVVVVLVVVLLLVVVVVARAVLQHFSRRRGLEELNPTPGKLGTVPGSRRHWCGRRSICVSAVRCHGDAVPVSEGKDTSNLLKS